MGFKEDIATGPAESSLLSKLRQYLLNEISGEIDGTRDPNLWFSPEGQDKIGAKLSENIASGAYSQDAANRFTNMYKSDLRAAQPFMAGAEGDPTFGNYAGLAGRAAAHHPFKTAALAGLTFGNLGGLVDNDKFGGQLGGLALGGLGAKALAGGNPYAALMLTLGGGELGSLFDKLRSKKEQEQAQQMNQYYRR